MPLIAVVAMLASCNKDEIPESYLRGGNSLILAPGGNLLIGGYNTVAGKSYDATLVLTDQQGSVLKSNTYGDTYSDGFYCVENANGGGFVAAGFTQKVNGGNPRMWVVMASADLTQTGSFSYGTNNSQGFNIIPCNNDGYLAAGYTQLSSNRDLYLVRINNAGTVIWEKNYGAKSQFVTDTTNDEAYCVAAAPDGGFFVTGSAKGYSNCCGRIFLMKISATGDSLWTKFFAKGIGYSVKISQDNKVLVGGTIFEGESNDFTIIKTDTDGNIIWNKRFTGSGYEFGATLVPTADGGCAITGITNSKGFGDQDAYLIKTNSAGELQWDYSFGGSNVDQGYGLVQMPDAGFCFTGLSNSGGSYIYLVRTSASGSQQWAVNIK